MLCTSPTVPELVIGDRHHIEHAIGNLIGNAIKFSPEQSEIVVNISTEKAIGDEHFFGNSFFPLLYCDLLSCGIICFSDVGSDKVTVVLAVKDEGPGMTCEEQDKLFRNFVQTRPGQVHKGGGAGLGLTIAKQIVNLHGGRIGVRSVKGDGSEFYFAIPFQVPAIF